MEDVVVFQSDVWEKDNQPTNFFGKWKWLERSILCLDRWGSLDFVVGENNETWTD